MRSRRLEAGALEQDRKFFAAQPADYPAAVRCLAPDAAENLIADTVSISVVDLFEMIDVEHDHRMGRRAPLRLLGLFKKGAAVEDAGQRIDTGEPDQFTLQTQQAFGRTQTRVQFLAGERLSNQFVGAVIEGVD
jgi:hypothetical protein